MLRRAAMGLLLVAACHKRAPEVPLKPGESGRPRVAPRTAVVGPVHWWDASGVCLDVPAGWGGLGRDGTGRLITLDHAETGTRVEIALESADTERDGLVRVFDDPGTYRGIPALGHAGVETWVSEIPGGSTLMVWHGSAGPTPVRVEVTWPFGRMFQSLSDVEELFRGICVER